MFIKLGDERLGQGYIQPPQYSHAPAGPAPQAPGMSSERPAGEKFGTHSGLGLSISKQIVEAHRGRIWAENRTDGKGAVCGARFLIRLPVQS